jgi:pimeloyl-ACP methyl ester carboxylesterase
LNNDSEQPLILVGHDRGARICHHLSVHNPEPTKFKILGAVLLDIVPTLVQFQTFSSPTASMVRISNFDPCIHNLDPFANVDHSQKGSFHWPFLATPHIAVPMIRAFGGDQWVHVCLDRWAGKGASSHAKLREHGAWDVYAETFKDEKVVAATCDDYRAGGVEDAEEQENDQREGYKIDSDVSAFFCLIFLPSKMWLLCIWGADNWRFLLFTPWIIWGRDMMCRKSGTSGSDKGACK